MTEIIKLLEIIGTIAFAVSGALVAIGAKLDVFGVVFVGCITAVGGGIVRDIILGINPPSIFLNYNVCFIAMVVSVIVFIIAYINRQKFNYFRMKIEYVNNFFDAIGLAAFSVTGAEVGYIYGFSDNGFIIVTIGMITVIGGGIFRDILTDTTPYVFKKHIYALASISGSLLYFILRKYFENIPLVSVSTLLLVVAIRMLATKYCWSLPKIELEDDND